MVTSGILIKNVCNTQILNHFSPESYEIFISGRSSDLSRFNRLPDHKWTVAIG